MINQIIIQTALLIASFGMYRTCRYAIKQRSKRHKDIVWKIECNQRALDRIEKRYRDKDDEEFKANCSLSLGDITSKK